MSKMNVARILTGGLVAGLIMNIGEAALHAGVLGDDTAVLYKTFNAPVPNASENAPMLIGATFLLGIMSVWVYAAIRPRFGAGAKTALIAGLAVWAIAHVWSGVYLGNGYSGIITPKLAFLPVFWGLLEAPIATIAGAALYKEK